MNIKNKTSGVEITHITDPGYYTITRTVGAVATDLQAALDEWNSLSRFTTEELTAELLRRTSLGKELE